MNRLILLLAVLLVAPVARAQEARTAPDGPVILFLVDNSASLPPLDPLEKRMAALEKMFSFLEGQTYRLVLFGARREIRIDDPTHYRNNGQWTDYYPAFERSRELMSEYPAGTEFRFILLTDGVMDPDPKEWTEAKLPAGTTLYQYVEQRLIEQLQELNTPLYVILVGRVPEDGVEVAGGEKAPPLIGTMIAAANGTLASAAAQHLSSFFDDDGLLFKKFVFRVNPEEGLKQVEPVVRRIVASPRAGVEVQLLTGLVLPLGLFLALLLGILVRSFPGPGDTEIVELAENTPVHLAVDRLHRTSDGWGTTGLSLVGAAKEAVATLTYQRPTLELTGRGLPTEGLDDLTLEILPLALDELRFAVDRLSDEGSKEEKIYALNLDYMAKNFDSSQAEKILASSPNDRHRIPALDFLRAKVHALGNDELRRRLTEPRVQLATYGKEGERKELESDDTCRIGRYGFKVAAVSAGGRKDARLVLHYHRVPSLLGMKTWLPHRLQRAFRLRRTLERVVS